MVGEDIDLAELVVQYLFFYLKLSRSSVINLFRVIFVVVVEVT